MTGINSALTGLVSAQQRLNVSANNTANAQTTVTEENGELNNKPFQPQAVQELSLAEGGVQSVVVPVQPAELNAFDPGHPSANEEGVVAYPNVKQDDEAVQRLISSRSFEANLKSVEAFDETLATLLDIKE